MSILLKKFTLWRGITVAIFALGLYATYLRFFKGWQAATNLSDAQPWGMWVGVATLGGVALSAGGFAIAAAVYLLGMERYRPVARVSVVISFLGYLTVCVGYAYELGLPWRFWHPLVYWNFRSVLFDVSMCIITYTTVLALEFAPQLLERLPWAWAHKLAHLQHKFVIALVLAGTLLSSMHQSFLGGLFLIMKGHIYPLWYSQYVHTMFYLSAIPAGICVVIMAIYLSMRSLNVKFDYAILVEMAKLTVPLVAIYAAFRAVDLITNGGYHYLFKWRSETAYFWLEILLMIVLPIIGFTQPKVLNNPVYLYWTAAIQVMGAITNRINVSITAMEYATHANYVPKWPEMMLTLMVVTAGVLVFRLCVLHLDVFPRAVKRERWLSSPASA
ncbi:MAG: NrfD/PsrC family molybdoenzyme membrane anchor subunit [Terriglobales bacterium]